jgi:hypothetical protein
MKRTDRSETEISKMVRSLLREKKKGRNHPNKMAKNKQDADSLKALN